MTRKLSKKKRKLLEEVMSNEDLLLLVFFCLPAKSLIRFKSVSKHWLSLISDPKFCSKYTRLNPKSPMLGMYFSYKYTTELRSVSFTQLNRKGIPKLAYMNDGWRGFESEVPAIRHACNGLFLCYYSYKEPYFVYNVTTRTSVVLPQHPIPACDYDSALLVFDPTKSTHFKVVSFIMCYRNDATVLHRNDEYKDQSDVYSEYCYKIDIYSSETQVWERMYFQAPHGNFNSDYKAICDGTIHWITSEKYHGRFEVDTEKLSFIQMPPETKIMEVENIRYFGECCGHLYLVYLPFCHAKSFDVYELEKDHNTVNRHMSVRIDDMRYMLPDSVFPREKWIFSVLCVVKENEGRDFVLLMEMLDKIVSYNLYRKTVKVLDELSVGISHLHERSYACARAFPFMPNLSLV